MELELIRRLRQRLPPNSRIPVGVGDDAAVLKWPGQSEGVVTTDMLADGVHFRLQEAGAARVGRKALAVNLSDLAAMAAQPHSAFVSVLLPRGGASQLATGLYDGMVPLAKHFEIPIAGGDTNCWDGPLVINVAVLGMVAEQKAVLRSGARPGDAILVTGSFGGSILGRHYDFLPRVHEALLLNDRYELHAAIDVSDGLSIDLWRVCEESGCGALLDLAAVPISSDARKVAASQNRPETALQRALGDGEDFELVLAVPPEEARRLLTTQPLEIALTQIGQFIQQPGLWQLDDSGTRQPLAVSGFQHGGGSN